jgi:hypothetical protein
MGYRNSIYDMYLFIGQFLVLFAPAEAGLARMRNLHSLLHQPERHTIAVDEGFLRSER